MLKNYEINNATVALIPVDKNTTKIYEEEAEYTVECNTNKIIAHNCKFYGSSYQGRCEGTKYLTGIKSKFPIIIEESRNIIFFPTSSFRNNQNTWVALNKIKAYDQLSYGKSYIILNNGKKISLDISLYSLDNQFCRANLLKAKLYDRKNN